MTEAQPTFSWAGIGRREGTRVHYESFTFAGELYSLGDCVYLLPEEDGALPYLAKLIRTYEETAAANAEKLVIEVQWFERRGSVPAALGAVMSEHEVVESDLCDTNLVGCIDRKAVVVRANSYTQASQLLPAVKRKAAWHFCRGVLHSATQQFTTYEELGQHAWGEIAAIGPQQQQQQYTMYPLNNGYSSGPALHLEDTEMPDAAQAQAAAAAAANGSSHQPATASGPAASCAANSRSRRAAAAARVAAAAAAGGGGRSGVRGVPGKVCCECGATQTPQWREGPLGPKTLCNACGVRYQRSQSKAKSSKRVSSDRGRGDRGSPQTGKAPKQQCLSRLSANSSGGAAAAAAGLSPTAASAETAAAGGAGGAFNGVGLDLSGSHVHGTRSNASKCSSRQQQRVVPQRSGLYLDVGLDLQQQEEHMHIEGSGTGPAQHEQQQQQQHCKVLQHPQQEQHLLSHQSGLHYYEDEGSPPNMHTHILEEAEEEDALQHQAPLHQSLNRSATHEAADTLQALAAHRQQQEQVAAAAHHAVSAAFCSSAVGSPSSNMLLSDQLQAADMPLLSLDDKDSVLPSLGGPDSLDASLTAHSLSPLRPRTQHPAAQAAAAHGSSSSSRLGGTASAVCASPGRLIAAMVQGLRLPTHLSLNASMSHQNAAAAAASSAPMLVPAAASGAAGPAAAAAGGAAAGHSWAPLNGTGLLMPVLRSSKNLKCSTGASPTAATAAANGTISCLPRSADSQPASAAVSSCDTVTAVGSNGYTPNSLSGVTPSGYAASGHCQLQQQLSGSSGNSCLLSQLRSVVFRASSYAPEVQGLGGLYPGPSSPRALQNLVHQLEQLPHTARVQLQQVSTVLEDTLSKAKAADAAVVAVTQVLAAKKQAAADARQEVERSIMHFQQVLGQISPQVAAAAAGTGSSSAYCSPVPTPVATDPGRCCIATMSSGCLAAAAAGGPICCGNDDCTVGSGRLGGNSPKVLVSQSLASHPTQGFYLSTDGFGSSAAAAAAADGNNLGQDDFCGDHSDADDLIRDPEEAAVAPAVVEPPAAVVSDEQDLVQQQQQQECSAGGGCCDNKAMMAAVLAPIKVEQLGAVSPTPAAAVVPAAEVEQLQSIRPSSTSGSSDSPAAIDYLLHQQHRLSPASSPPPQHDELMLDSLFGSSVDPAAATPPPAVAAHPAAEAAPVAA